jgi:acetylornithine deacetylase/succinyl-diaminopimelate desuccinylase-like protein
MLTTDLDIEQYLDERRESRIDSYKALLRIPSISALPQHAADCRATAEWIATDLRAMGIEHVAVEDTTDGHPFL